jgi:DUF438 domain-containing protein
MESIKEALDNLQTPVLAADADMVVFYANDSCKALFKDALEQEDFVGKHMEGCHPPEAFEKLRKLYEEFKAGTKSISHYTRDTPEGKITVVQVPFFKDGEFAGAMEYIFAGSLA